MDPNFGDRVTVGGLPDREASPLGWFDQVFNSYCATLFFYLLELTSQYLNI